MAAMTTSAQLSYRLHLVNTSTLPDHRMTPTSRPQDQTSVYADYTGVYDPKTSMGSGVNKGGGDTQVRLIDGRYYTRFPGAGEPWFTRQGTLVQALVLNGGRAWAPTDGASADPAVLLTALRRLGSVTLVGKSGAGAQALDTYDFSYDIAGDGSVKPHQLTGTIVVRDQSNLIAKITMRTTVTGANPQIADGGQMTFTTVMTFSDYGLPVSVQAPTGDIRQLKPLPGVVIVSPKHHVKN